MNSVAATPQHEAVTQCSADAFHNDVDFLEANLKPKLVGHVTLPALDIGTGDPLIFVPIHEHLEFVYARQIRSFSASRRVILYRRRESRKAFVTLADRAEELRDILDAFGIEAAHFIAHGDAAMVLAEFALRYPGRCRSLVIVSLAADYRINPHPLIWGLHEIFLRLPIERLVPRSLLLRIIMRYINHFEPQSGLQSEPPLHEIPRGLIEAQFRKIAAWPALYRYSVLPVIHSYDIHGRVSGLNMPILLLNRWDDALAPEPKTAWLAQQLPNCVYHVVCGRGRFFLYAEAERVTPLIEAFLARNDKQNKIA